MYKNTNIKVKIGNHTSKSHKYERGVRQGCPTSPLIFNIYYDSILKQQEPISVEGIQGGLRGLMFADDTVIVASTREELVNKLHLISIWCKENYMELNPSKCGTMEINSDEYWPQMRPVTYENDIIPSIDKYTYLGIEINNKLDLLEMAKFRVNKGKCTLEVIRSTLSNFRIPLQYKIMLIKSVLIPRLTFGIEIFGMSLERTQPMKRVLDNALKCIVKKSNFCRLRVYEELGITPLYVQSAVARARGFTKWKTSRGLIANLISSHTNFKSRKSTWTKESSRWLKSMRINTNMQLEEITHQVMQKRMGDLNQKDSSIASTNAALYNITYGKKLFLSEINLALDPIAVNALLKIRTGTFKFTNDLVRTLTLPPEYHNKCVSCNKIVKEDVWHLLCICQTYNDVRRKHQILKIPTGRETPEGYKVLILSSLLEGESVASHTKLPEEVLETIKYLSQTIPRRNAIIARRRGPTQPSRS
jgi:hypothetical protein